MKKIFLNIGMLLVVLFAFSCCSDSNISDLKLDGNCSVTAITLDGYKGTMDIASRSITVNIPETYPDTLMKVTKLELSNGATSNLLNGDKLNMSAPHVIHVTNGNLYLDWTLVVKQDKANITSFKVNGLYTGIINEQNKTISVTVPESEDVTSLVPEITCSDGAVISPAGDIATDFTHPVVYTVTNNTAVSKYRVTVTPIGKPSAIFVGLPTTMDGLNIEELTACKWMLQNIPNSIYVSFDDIKNGNIDLSKCKVIWWHYHVDGGVDGKAAFEKDAPEAINAVVKLRDYYKNGGSFLFTRYATNMPAELGAVANDACPNNCWGENENAAETVSSPWSFFITGHTKHALFQNLVMNSSEPTAVYTCDAGYRITNSTAQWHIGNDWGGYADYTAWRNDTGGLDLAYGGDGAIVIWEFPATGSKGDILCIGSGCYDWYSLDEVTEYYHANVERMTLNAFNYLMNK
ncbi:MAG: DUF4960 domain-containing protein [Prevotella sp.]|jgi:hypothetical protein|nr:DUF4960 domain-containing protein [Prevotella sp.]MCH4212416.1 DUF4960 domain-containing protein [Prevotella sp.]MCH4241965.1 DUF4960 domain-containing protein [Prevotella sp.]